MFLDCTKKQQITLLANIITDVDAVICPNSAQQLTSRKVHAFNT